MVNNGSFGFSHEMHGLPIKPTLQLAQSTFGAIIFDTTWKLPNHFLHMKHDHSNFLFYKPALNILERNIFCECCSKLRDLYKGL